MTAAYRILSGTRANCAGGATPWGRWLSCEEVDRGYVWDTDPAGAGTPVRRDAMGRFQHEAAAVDPRNVSDAFATIPLASPWRFLRGVVRAVHRPVAVNAGK